MHSTMWLGTIYLPIWYNPKKVQKQEDQPT